MTKRTFKKDVTDDEVSAFMAANPAVRTLMAAVRLRTSDEKKPKPEKAATEYRRSNASRRADKPEGRTEIVLTEDERIYARSVHEQRNLTMTGRRDALGWSTDRAGKVCRALIEKKILSPFTVNVGRAMGGTIKLLELTEGGADALGVKPKYPRRGRVGAEHWWWQIALCRHFQKQGFEASIEKELNGKFADVGVFQDGEWHAYEVAISPSNEVRNVQKDIDEAGFDRVIVCCRDVPVKKAVTDRLNEHLSAEQLSKTEIVLLSDFPFVRLLFQKKTVGHGSPQSG